MNKTQAYEIVLSHLITQLGEDEARKQFNKHKSTMFAKHGLAWALGKENLHFFCELFLHDFLFDYSGDNVPLSQLHYQIWDELENTILHKNNSRNLYILPRGFGKTTTITVVVAMWCALYRHHPFTVIQSAVEDRAKNFISTIRAKIEGNELIKSCFGDVLGNKSLKDNASELELDISPERSKIEAVSSTSSVRGISYNAIRVGLLLVDDGQDPEKMRTEEAMEEFYNNFSGGIMKALQTQRNNVIAVGTVYRVGDLYDRLYKSKNWSKVRSRCVNIDDIDAYFANHPHWKEIRRIKADETNPNCQDDAKDYYLAHKQECYFPVIWSKYDCYDLFCEYVDNPVTFKREFQCDITALGEKRISSVATMQPDAIERLAYTKTILAVDPASSTAKKADYSAFCVMSENGTNCKYVRKLKIAKLGFQDYIDEIISLLKQFTDINCLFIEKNVYLGADVIQLRERIAQDRELCNRPLQILNKTTTRNKDARIDAIIPSINNHRIVFNADDTEAIEQIKSFSGCAFTEHDDAIDSLCLAMENIGQIATAGSYGYVSYRDIFG